MSTGTGSVKRVTHNFNRLMNFDGSAVQEFGKWRDEQIEKGARIAFDRRNHIYCVNPTMDYEMYYNYLNYLNESYNEWMNYGYFDMGMVPYMMWPSFMESSPALEQMRRVARQAAIDLVPVPSVSLLKPSYISNGVDYWIFREDLFKLSKFMESRSQSYNFGFNSPDEVSLSKFLKPLADISRAARAGGSV